MLIETKKAIEPANNHQPKGANMKLYHGSYEIIKPEIKAGAYALGSRDNVFDGLFASDEQQVAESHGEYIHIFEIEDDKIASNVDLDCEEALEVLRAETYIEDEDRLIELFEAVVDDKNLGDFTEDELKARSEFDFEFGWEAQRLRGRIAKALGFKAVECRDEHGTSYLIVEA